MRKRLVYVLVVERMEDVMSWVVCAVVVLLVQGALLVYDITDRASFERMQNWLRELKKLVGPEICIVIAGNKIDQKTRQQVPEKEAKDFAALNNAK